MTISVNGTNGVTYPAGGVANTAGALVGATDSQNISNKFIVPNTGTTSTPALKLTAGTLMTSPTAGAIEYDGNVAYLSAAANGRGLMPGYSIIALTSNTTGLTGTTAAQPLFGSSITNTSFVVPATGTYLFGINAELSRASSGGSHQIQISFGGTATVSSIFYRGFTAANGVSASINGYIANTDQFVSQSTAAVGAQSGTFGAAAGSWSADIAGAVTFSSTGTFIPQYKTTSGVGVAYSSVAGSYMVIYPIGNQTGGAAGAIRIGNWS